MREFLIIFGVIVLIVLIIIFPLRARAQVYVNLFDGVIVYSIKILFVKLLLGRITLNFPMPKVQVENEVNKIFIEGDSNKYDLILAKQVIKRIKIAKLNLISSIGLFNPFLTSLTAGTVYSLGMILTSLTINNNYYADVITSIKPNFDENELELIAQLSIQISLIKILMSVISAKKEYKKYVQKQTAQNK